LECYNDLETLSNLNTGKGQFVSGSGTFADPYNISTYSSGIWLVNISAYGIIENCEIDGSVTVNDEFYSIALQNCSNVQILDNIVEAKLLVEISINITITNTSWPFGFYEGYIANPSLMVQNCTNVSITANDFYPRYETKIEFIFMAILAVSIQFYKISPSNIVYIPFMIFFFIINFGGIKDFKLNGFDVALDIIRFSCYFLSYKLISQLKQKISN
jgi:hypothetical protein